MTEILNPPDKFESEKEFKQYIAQLYDHLDSIEDDPKKSADSKLEVEKELNQIQDQIATNTEELEEIHTALEEAIQSLESIELHGNPSSVGLRETLRSPGFGEN